jgi:hypothetical protein
LCAHGIADSRRCNENRFDSHAQPSRGAACCAPGTYSSLCRVSSFLTQQYHWIDRQHALRWNPGSQQPQQGHSQDNTCQYQRIAGSWMTLSITEEIRVQAPIDVTFATLIEQLGPFNETPEGQSMNMKIEAWPGGRWYRDLGDGNGHFWGHVQAIKRPTLLEICGPLFMSYPVVSNLQYRLREE